MGFGFGGVLALHLAAQDERIAGIACLGTPDDLGPLVSDPEAFLAHCRRTGVITSPDFPESVEAWAKELSVLHPAEDATLLKGRPILLVHGSEDPDVPVSGMRALVEAATGPSELHVVLGRRALAAGRSQGHRRARRLARAAPLEPHNLDTTKPPTPLLRPLAAQSPSCTRRTTSSGA